MSTQVEASLRRSNLLKASAAEVAIGVDRVRAVAKRDQVQPAVPVNVHHAGTATRGIFSRLRSSVRSRFAERLWDKSNRDHRANFWLVNMDRLRQE